MYLHAAREYYAIFPAYLADKLLYMSDVEWECQSEVDRSDLKR